MILLIDNYDSFVFNLQRYLVRLGQTVCVVRNDDPRLGESGKLPILGVCLGHQVIYEAFGGKVVRASVPVHGRASPMRLQASRLFTGLPQGHAATEIQFARYHSLIAQPESLPAELQIIARCEDGHIMAVEHRHHATYGVQFHPESILSPDGYRVLHNFLKIAGLPVADNLPPADWLPHPARADAAEVTLLNAADGSSNQASAQGGSSASGETRSQGDAGPPAEAGPFASLPSVGAR